MFAFWSTNNKGRKETHRFLYGPWRISEEK